MFITIFFKYNYLPFFIRIRIRHQRVSGPPFKDTLGKKILVTQNIVEHPCLYSMTTVYVSSSEI